MDQVNAYFNSGLESCRSGDYQKGITFFDLALSINPTHLESIYNRAKAKYKLHELEACLSDFAAAIEIAPQNADLYSERAVVYYRLEQNVSALADLSTAISLDSKNPYRYASRAYIKDKFADFQGAIDDYNKAIELDPKDAISYNNKGLVEEKMGLKQASAESFKKADSLTGYQPSPKTESEEQEMPGTPSPASKVDVNSGPKVEEKNPSRWQFIKQIFTSREGRNDFIGFVFDMFKRKS